MVCMMVEFSITLVLKAVIILLIDIDECALGTHQCAQNCSNAVGSYTCSCRTGYRLSSDRQTCISEFDINISSE